MAQPYVIKNFSDCYQYNAGDYEKNVYKFFIESKIIEKNTESFEDIRFSIKKLSPSICVADTLDSPNVILLYNSNPLPRAFKVFAAKDLKSGDNKLKVFIDLSDIISTKTGSITIDPRNIDKLVSFLTSALMMRIYYSVPEKLFGNSTLMKSGTMCFAEMVAYVIDWLRITGVDRAREKCLYMSALYYNMCVMGRDYTSSVESIAKQVSNISSKDAEMLDVVLSANNYNNVKSFVEALSIALKADGLKLDNFMAKWLHLFGPGTQFGMELYPAFSSIITNVYNGSYLVTNQKTVEKVCGRSIVEYTTALFNVGNSFN